LAKLYIWQACQNNDNYFRWFSTIFCEYDWRFFLKTMLGSLYFEAESSIFLEKYF
jgi:hypothetical protein